jgi:hypothetical protein
LYIVNVEFENQGFVQGSGTRITFNHLVTGAGDYGGTVTFLGDTNFGNSPAQIDVLGSVIFGPANTHLVEIGGLVPGSEFDQVIATGIFELSGPLEVGFIDLNNDYIPQAGDRFAIITADGGVSGTFTTETLPPLSGPDLLNA